jgi:hypothetical protein
MLWSSVPNFTYNPSWPCFSPSKQIIHVSLTTLKYELECVYSDLERFALTVKNMAKLNKANGVLKYKLSFMSFSC